MDYQIHCKRYLSRITGYDCKYIFRENPVKKSYITDFVRKNIPIFQNYTFIMYSYDI